MAGWGATGWGKVNPIPTTPKTISNPTGKVPGQTSGGAPKSTAPRANAPKGLAPGIPKQSAPKNTGTTGRATPTAATGNYGYSTTSKTPFNPYSQYPTVGALNKAAIASAAPGYQPLLDQNAADTQAENAANQQRNSQLSGIYSQYGSQAQQAFQETQAALNAMIGANATGDQQSQEVLQAALSSANGGQNSLAQQMGLSGQPTAQEIAPYQAAAQGAAQGTGSELQALGGGLLSTVGAGVGNAALEGAQQKDIESTRHQAALQSGAQSRDAIVAQIPALIEKAREQLITDALNASGLSFQQTLAEKQFGLSAKTADANIANAQGTLKLNQQNAATNRYVALTQLNQNQQTIDNNAKAIAASVTASQAKLKQALAAAQGKQQANALKYLTAWAAPNAQETNKTSTTTLDPKTGASVRLTAGQVNPLTWHRDAGSALKQLMVVYGLDLKTALSFMSTLTTPIGGGTNMTVGEWASTFIQRAAAAKNPTQGGWLGALVKQVQAAGAAAGSIAKHR